MKYSLFYEFICEDANATGISFKSDARFTFASHGIVSAFANALLRAETDNH